MGAPGILRSTATTAIAALKSEHRTETVAMYDPLMPWNTWFALTSRAARLYWATQVGMLRGIAPPVGGKTEAETDRLVAEGVGATEKQVPAASSESKKKRQVARSAKSDRHKRRRLRSHRVRSGRVDHPIKKNRKRRAA